MRIGFDVSQTGADKAGCGFFSDNLIRYLVELLSEEEFVVYPTFGNLDWDYGRKNDATYLKQANVRRGLHHADFEAARSFWENPPADFESALGAPDVIHANSFFCPLGLVRSRLVYTLYDLSFLENPEWTTESNRVGCFTGVFNASLTADYILAISEFSRRHFLATFPHYPADRTGVIHLASRFAGAEAGSVGPPSRRLARLVHGSFWLAVGTIEPRKNYEGLVRAYARLRAMQGRVLPLVIVGKRGWMMKHFDALLRDLGVASDVRLLGYVDEVELRWLYRNCFALVYPTFWEGFGLPLVEALSHGAPVVASDVSSIPEVLGDAGLLIDPHDIDSLADAMHRLSSSPELRGSLVARAQAQAKRFSWRAAAQRAAEIYREVLARPRYSDSSAPFQRTR